jgi:peptidoglycan/LPS O-acetylase OafA/YrhL
VRIPPAAGGSEIAPAASGRAGRDSARINSSPGIPSLTGLRFLAAFAVVTAHSIGRFRLGETDIGYWVLQTSGFGMSLFFVLSGFVIHYNYRRLCEEGRVQGIAQFLWARFARLYPLFLLLLIYEITFSHELRASIAEGSPTPELIDMLHALPYYLLFLQSWLYVPGAEHSLIYELGGPMSVTWSISTEWFFYIVYPLIALILIRVKRPSAAFFGAVIWSISWTSLSLTIADSNLLDDWSIDKYGPIANAATGFQDSFRRWLLYFSPYLRIGEFMLGCLTAHIYVLLQNKSASRSEAWIGRGLLVFALLTLGLTFYFMYVPNGTLAFMRQLSYNFGLAPSIAVIMFCTARHRSLLSVVVSWKPFIALGEASYSIYLLHFVVLLLAAGDTIIPPSTSQEMALLLVEIFFSLSFVLILSLGVQQFVEAPARRWLRGLWPSRQFSPARFVAGLSIIASPAAAAACIMLLWSNPAETSPGGLRVVAASYGENCGARPLNATRALRLACDGRSECHYIVDVNALGDPAAGCAKSFFVQYACPGGARISKTIPGEAGFRSHLDLSCERIGARALRSR